ncbi:MAG: IMP cyclohydrolase, partial [Nanoarchaeota archaeon]|nr:IMP cyclohydrolase [Nanoarchaeota archaeon]
KLYLEEPHYMYDEHSDTLIDLNSFEPDAPNWTPRINAMMQGNKSYMHIVKRDNKGIAEHKYFLFPESLDDIQGQGLLLTTYDGKNVNPLPSFTGLPRKITQTWNSPEATVEEVWKALPENFRVSVASYWISAKGVRHHCAIKNQE